MKFSDINIINGELNFIYHVPNITPLERPAVKIISYDDLRRK